MSNHSKCNVKSELLSAQDNKFLFNVLGKGCFTLATCVAQLFAVERQKRKRHWVKLCCGVVCFVKDNPKKSYFIRLYDVQTQQMLWEQEIYTKFKYNAPKEFFHTFEAHDCHVGLNFASENEAERFKGAIEEKLLERRAKKIERDERKKVTLEPVNQTEDGIVSEKTTIDASQVPNTETAENTENDKPKMRKKKNKKKRKLTLDDVGVPSDFRHVSHMSWGINDGPHMDRLDPDMKALLEQMGIKEQSQVDNDTMDFIYQFVDKHGGANAVREDFAWHIPAEPSHRPGETVDIAQFLPAAPSHPVGTVTDSAHVTEAASLPVGSSVASAQPLKTESHSEGNMVPQSAVKVMDITAALPTLHHTRPPPPVTKPLPNLRPPPQAGKPHPPKPPPPSSKPPPIVKPTLIKNVPNQSAAVTGSSHIQSAPLSPAVSAQATSPIVTVHSVVSPKHPKPHTSTLQTQLHTPSSQNVTPPTSTQNMQAPPTSQYIPPPPPLPDITNVSRSVINTPAESVLKQVTLESPVSLATPMPTPMPPVDSKKAVLLNEIQTLVGTSLRQVQTDNQPPERAQLLTQIRTGTSLRHIEQTNEPPAAKRGSIAAALMSQLMKRKTVVQFSDHEYSSDEFDDDWDED